MHGGGIPGAKHQFAMEFWNGVSFGQNNFEPVRQARASALWPFYRALGCEFRNAHGELRREESHQAGSLAPATGVRKTMARCDFWRYCFAAPCTFSRVTARKPSRMVLTSCGSLSKSVKQASRCIKPYLGM